METRKIFRLLGSLAIMVSFSAWLPAQTFELNPYAGGILGSGSVDTGAGSFDLKDQGIFGVRGAYFLTENVEIEGNFGYINHLEFEGSDPESRGYLWEASGSYRFDLEQIKPFLIMGIGGLTADVDEDNPEFINASTPVIGDGDTFLTLSYGGGLKAPLLWGPVGLRSDIRGRTVPNLHGKAVTWLELTGGLTFTF